MSEWDDLDCAFRHLRLSVVSMLDRFEVFGQEWSAAVERAYLGTHRRLPGSPRTRRLRKKRLDRLLAWDRGERR
jgi:hypothetical protein